MEEIIVRINRTLACFARLRILSFLAAEEETAPTVLAAKLRMPLGLVCVHLRRLTSAGLIQRRRSGAWCYCVAKSPYGERTLSGQVGSWLFNILRLPSRTIDNCTVGQLRSFSGSDDEAKLHRIIFDAATAFTNVRRLQILRRLNQGEAVTVETLTRELHMSASAVCRHMAKLARRGYAVAEPAMWPCRYRLAQGSKTPVHAELLRLVRANWGGEKLRS